MYIQPPEVKFKPITIHKGKRKHIKRAKKNEVPEFYRKNRKEKLKKQISEAKWQFNLATENIRKEMKTWTLWRKIDRLCRKAWKIVQTSAKRQLSKRSTK